MDSAYVSALAALAGSTIGGLTTLAASWLTQHVQFRAQQRAGNHNLRVELYKSFIEEASRLYADAYEHDQASVASLVNLYALISRMRILSSPQVIDCADRVARVIIETYLSPNRSFRDVVELLSEGAAHPLRDFSDTCRRELSFSARAG
jgi:hypothetical protein